MAEYGCLCCFVGGFKMCDGVDDWFNYLLKANLQYELHVNRNPI